MQLEGALNLVIYMVGSLWVWTYLKDVNNQYQVWNPSQKKKKKKKKKKKQKKTKNKTKTTTKFEIMSIFSIGI